MAEQSIWSLQPLPNNLPCGHPWLALPVTPLWKGTGRANHRCPRGRLFGKVHSLLINGEQIPSSTSAQGIECLSNYLGGKGWQNFISSDRKPNLRNVVKQNNLVNVNWIVFTCKGEAWIKLKLKLRLPQQIASLCVLVRFWCSLLRAYLEMAFACNLSQSFSYVPPLRFTFLWRPPGANYFSFTKNVPLFCGSQVPKLFQDYK